MTDIELGMIPWVGHEATSWVAGTLEGAALRVYRSFDLRSVRADSDRCLCPYHGTEACDCQLVVLLVYWRQGQSAPATVVLHGHQGRTWISLAEAPDQELEATITRALAPACTNRSSSRRCETR